VVRRGFWYIDKCVGSLGPLVGGIFHGEKYMGDTLVDLNLSMHVARTICTVVEPEQG